MADDDDDKTPKPEVIHHGLTTEELEARLTTHKSELQSLIEEGSAADKREKDELRDEIATLKADIKASKEAEEAKDSARGSETTIVLPPNEVKPQQQHDEDGKAAEPTPAGEEGKKKGGWKKIW